MVSARHFILVLSMLLVAFVPRDGHAADPTVARARKHFEAGQALFELGNYEDAIREFSAGYSLTHRVEFLLNLGQCHRKNGDRVKAREMYQRYLKDAPPDAGMRADVSEIVRDLDKSLAQTPQEPVKAKTGLAMSAQSTKAAAKKTLIVEDTRPDETPAGLVVAAPAPKKKPFIKRHWWIIPVSILVAAGAATGIALGVTSSGGGAVCANPPADAIACLAARGTL